MCMATIERLHNSRETYIPEVVGDARNAVVAEVAPLTNPLAMTNKWFPDLVLIILPNQANLPVTVLGLRLT